MTTDATSAVRNAYPVSCGYCGQPFTPARQSAAYCSAACRRADFDERAKGGKVASVRRLKGGRMSVVLHMEHDVGIEPGQVVRVAGDSARPDSTRNG